MCKIVHIYRHQYRQLPNIDDLMNKKTTSPGGSLDPTNCPRHGSGGKAGSGLCQTNDAPGLQGDAKGVAASSCPAKKELPGLRSLGWVFHLCIPHLLPREIIEQIRPCVRIANPPKGKAGFHAAFTSSPGILSKGLNPPLWMSGSLAVDCSTFAPKCAL
jgi:hypothetical protein